MHTMTVTVRIISGEYEKVADFDTNAVDSVIVRPEKTGFTPQEFAAVAAIFQAAIEHKSAFDLPRILDDGRAVKS